MALRNHVHGSQSILNACSCVAWSLKQVDTYLVPGRLLGRSTSRRRGIGDVCVITLSINSWYTLGLLWIRRNVRKSAISGRQNVERCKTLMAHSPDRINTQQVPVSKLILIVKRGEPPSHCQRYVCWLESAAWRAFTVGRRT